VGQLKLLVGLYVAPLKTFSRILDEGRLLIAILAAVVTALTFQLPGNMVMVLVFRDMARMTQEQVKRPKPVPSAEHKPPRRAPRVPTRPPLARVIDDFTVSQPIAFFPWSTLMAVALCFAPAAIMVLTIAEGWRSFCSILYRDYLALLVCFFMAWSCAYMPIALLRGAQLFLHVPGYMNPVFGWMAHLYFLVLCVCAIRTVAGVDFPIAAGAVAGGWVGAIGGLLVGGVAGFAGYWIMSPCLLYALWARAQREAMWIGSGLRSRQALKRQLEISTMNPRDADAHCQLGMIYEERRQMEAAAKEFRAAIEVDSNEPDARYHLGCILRRQGRAEEALEHLRRCACINHKHALSEVWREIGTAALLADRLDEALGALEKFLERRPYDPEGRCWYGRALVKADRRAAAERAFREAIEAVRTMPPARRRQVREWEGQASKELRMLRAARNRTAASLATVR